MGLVQVEVTADKLNVRSGPAASFATTRDPLSKGDKFTVDNKQNGWYHLQNKQNGKDSWVNASYVKVVQNLSSSTTQKTNTKNTTVAGENATTVASQGIDSKILQLLYDKVKTSDTKLTASTRMFGAPHQFIKSTDYRLDNQPYSLGRKYIETIITESPIVYLLPGKPNYLPDMDAAERDGLKNFLLGKNPDAENKSILDKITGNKDSRYFTFLTDYSTYMRYVNMLCRFAAVYMGVGDLVAPGSNKAYKFYDWSNYRYQDTYMVKDGTNKSMFDLSELKTDMYEAMFGNYQYTQFYVDPSSSFSESANNNTTDSKLAGLFDSAEGVIKEVAFLTNSMALNNVDKVRESFASGMSSIADKMKVNSNENFFSRLLDMSSTVMSGSNIIFPQLWGDAAYNKSYNITINLASPYGDKESVFLNIIVPLMHILAMTLPRQTTANSYASPFLVKAFAKGWFSCEMGIIDSISIEKGEQGSWSVNGLPTVMRINLSIKDLYSNMMVTPNSSPDLFFQNQGMLDFLAVTCGVDITKPQFQTKLEAIFATLFNTVGDIPTNWFRDIVQGLRNTAESLYKL